MDSSYIMFKADDGDTKKSLRKTHNRTGSLIGSFNSEIKKKVSNLISTSGITASISASKKKNLSDSRSSTPEISRCNSSQDFTQLANYSDFKNANFNGSSESISRVNIDPHSHPHHTVQLSPRKKTPVSSKFYYSDPEEVQGSYKCSLFDNRVYNGLLSLSKNKILFISKTNDFETKLIIPIKDIVSVDKYSTSYSTSSLIISTASSNYTFYNFENFNSAYDLIFSHYRSKNIRKVKNLNAFASSQSNKNIPEFKLDVTKSNSAADPSVSASTFTSAKTFSITKDKLHTLPTVIIEKKHIPTSKIIEYKNPSYSSKPTDKIDSTLIPPKHIPKSQTINNVIPTLHDTPIKVNQNLTDAQNESEFIPKRPIYPPRASTRKNFDYSEIIHHPNSLLESTVDIPLPIAARLIFFGLPFPTDSYSKYLNMTNQEISELAEFRQKNMAAEGLFDISIDKWKNGIPNANDKLKVKYIRPLNLAIGPKQTRTNEDWSIKQIDFENFIVLECSVVTPDVPAGNSFVVKVLYSLERVDNSVGETSTLFKASFLVEWSKKSWLKSKIEGGVSSGLKSNCELAIKNIRTWEKQNLNRILVNKKSNPEASSIPKNTHPLPVPHDYAANQRSRSSKNINATNNTINESNSNENQGKKVSFAGKPSSSLDYQLTDEIPGNGIERAIVNLFKLCSFIPNKLFGNATSKSKKISQLFSLGLIVLAAYTFTAIYLDYRWNFLIEFLIDIFSLSIYATLYILKKALFLPSKLSSAVFGAGSPNNNLRFSEAINDDTLRQLQLELSEINSKLERTTDLLAQIVEQVLLQ
ncbi:putative membrane protein [Smittium culicis]|uniref:Putative membrane protein n=1 Tax=Smittium culicis TaxID=133412 RepID=A0A1R1XWQ1_9FUNG|nr:putative membrane protein [Smittium culicis]